ncbi:hypothetical protein Q428_02405 [Fervidicella metallireducens AeB]|uniref:Uncharacterized protein n=1 Tax=Fervidicella metallireducens AeB TaxID=1403537 RepID=A0A017RXQ2_9CLOT|nr:DUF523 domain-containing protein [Fervidicella metallireducens]EYE89457.1 hypothetical protein Q428_02405 [Fervidicella metallireducens AeB]
MYLISACLCGVNCKYNGGNNFNEKVYRLYKENKALLVCPEELGGLPTPRTPCEIVEGSAIEVLNGKGKILNKDGLDVTENFIKGAKEVLKVAKAENCKLAILKSKSPSCGKGQIYDGSFSGKLTNGNGITAEILIENGVEVFTENDI